MNAVANNSGKRKYRNTLEFVESGFRACWKNASDLVLASQKLSEARLHAPSLSLSVLALEELGKLVAIDGLLFARHADHKSAAFAKSGRSHSSKLAFVELLPILLLNLSRVDARHGKEKQFNIAMAIGIKNLETAGNVVMQHLGEKSFLSLDRWKQQGFYVSPVEHLGRFKTPSEAVPEALAKAVEVLTLQAVKDLEFLLKDGNLERYIAQARSVRAALTEEQHRELEQIGKETFVDIFGGDSAGAEEVP